MRTSPEQAAREIRSSMREGATFVVKRGPRGAISIGPDSTLVEAVASDVRVVDTIGAGDVFNAAFLAAMAASSVETGCFSTTTR